MGRDSPPAVQKTTSGRDLFLPVDRPARPDTDVFVNLSETVAELKAEIAEIDASGERMILFVRAPVASGKTTLVEHLTTEHSSKFVKVTHATSEQDWYANVVEASGLPPDTRCKTALEEIAKQGKTVVIDEAHTLFAHPNVVDAFFKQLHTVKFLLFSASGSAAGTNNTPVTVTTPNEIRHKYLWYPPPPNAEQLSDQLAEAKWPVLLDAASVDFFTRLCGGHRGIFMCAMK